MHVTKLRSKAHGLIPAAAYFADIAARLEALNAHEAALQEGLDDEDRVLEEIYRKNSHAHVEAPLERHPMM
jgi:hypothetical protein